MKFLMKLAQMYNGGFDMLREYHDRLCACLNTPVQSYPSGSSNSARGDYLSSRSGIDRKLRNCED
jgi:hypothetical protein